ncbi:hypothetical protein OG264_18540 [Streptomyces xanthophaeus]|uniref:hypothetical protein n=1 Tax=Streptomyces xanthophaeus TaxID=67385 RepID=UPI003868A232|nr:hypothetical protein OG264_18540 [Streptomyces xanthophaeus]WST61703.1 hypothetical protein OG605_19895 [Streptomyces xanthophaeus]
MSAYVETLERLLPLWQAPDFPPRWVIWQAGGDEVMVFDREFNVPVDVDDAALDEVLRRMREAGAPESADYPGRACG